MSDDNNGRGSRLFRPKQGRMGAGVCAGLAAYLKVDVSLVRLAFGVFTFFYGLGALIYVIAWAILPEEGEGKSIAESFVGKYRPDQAPKHHPNGEKAREAKGTQAD